MSKRQQTAIVIIAFFHACGIAGMLIPALKPWVLPLTPIVLILSFAAAIVFHSRLTLNAIIPFTVIALAGFFAEVAGVACGFIFGTYQYGMVLKPQLFDVPLIIGINWLALAFYTFIISGRLTENTILRIISGAALMTAFDFVLEPVAVKLNFWVWADAAIPLQNYVAWFALSLIFQTVLTISLRHKYQGPGDWIYFIQLIFFLILGMIL